MELTPNTPFFFFATITASVFLRRLSTKFWCVSVGIQKSKVHLWAQALMFGEKAWLAINIPIPHRVQWSWSQEVCICHLSSSIPNSSNQVQLKYRMSRIRRGVHILLALQCTFTYFWPCSVRFRNFSSFNPTTQDPTEHKICLYELSDFQGNKMEIHEDDVPTLWAHGFCDRVGSVRVPGGTWVLNHYLFIFIIKNYLILVRAKVDPEPTLAIMGTRWENSSQMGH